MSERTAKAARRRNGATPSAPAIRSKTKSGPKPEANPTPPVADNTPPATEAPAHPGVLVLRVPTGTPGEEQVQILPMNGIDELSIPSVLRFAANLKEQQLGI